MQLCKNELPRKLPSIILSKNNRLFTNYIIIIILIIPSESADECAINFGPFIDENTCESTGLLINTIGYTVYCYVASHRMISHKESL